MASQRNRVGKSFGTALKAARLESEMTQEALAELSDFKTGYISMLEAGLRQPTVTAIVAFEEAMGLAPGTLVLDTVTNMKGRKINPIHRRALKKSRSGVTGSRP